VTHYGLDGLGIETRLGWDFLHPYRLSLVLTTHLHLVKWSNVHSRTGHEDPDVEERYSLTLSLILVLDGGGLSVPRLGLLTPRKDPVPIVQGVGWAPGPVWTGVENFSSTRIQSPDLPACRELLYWLHYPSPWRPPSAEIKEGVELYISPCGPLWHVLGWTLPLPVLIPHCHHSVSDWSWNSCQSCRVDGTQGAWWTFILL
jgi:hypothetical protein